MHLKCRPPDDLAVGSNSLSRLEGSWDRTVARSRPSVMGLVVKRLIHRQLRARSHATRAAAQNDESNFSSKLGVLSADGVAQAYASGVSMGANLTHQDGAPKFAMWAQADANSAPLQRLQIVKGWIDASGETHEEVIDVACAGGVAVNGDTNRCPDNGATVDLVDCSIRAGTRGMQSRPARSLLQDHTAIDQSQLRVDLTGSHTAPTPAL